MQKPILSTLVVLLIFCVAFPFVVYSFLFEEDKFIKGFDEGDLDFISTKKNEKSVSNLKIYDFKLKEVPALTKLLTLASLQGIADILTGEGIRFDEFEMKFNNQKIL